MLGTVQFSDLTKFHSPREKFLFSPLIHKTSPGRGKADTISLLHYLNTTQEAYLTSASLVAFDKTTVSVI